MTVTAACKQAMKEAVSKYAWGYDNGDFDMLGSVFAKDATSGGTVTGTDIRWGPMAGRDEIVSVLKSIRDSQTDQRRHNVFNWIFTDVGGDRASLKCNLALASTEGGQTRLMTGGYYEVDFIRTGEGWLITRLDGVLDSPF